jgi:TonB family protein
MTESWKQWEGYVVNGEFSLQRYLGGSDHSAVFLVERRSGEPRRAVLKLVPAALNDSESQILRWKLAMKLPHPHLIRIYDGGRCDLGAANFLYVVTEVADEDLAQIFPHRALSATETREVLRSVVQALSYLHGKGFAHGQIKPTNIMAVSEQVKLASDSLCAVGDRAQRRTSSVYDPPEATSGSISPPGDIWALGMTLVEALTQRPPVREGNKQPVVPKDLPEPFREIARNCLKLDPEGRWTVAQIAARLEPSATKAQVLAPVAATKAPPPTAVNTAPQSQPSRPFLLPLGAGVLVLLLLAGWKLSSPGSQPDHPETTASQEIRTHAPAELPQAGASTAQQPTGKTTQPPAQTAEDPPAVPVQHQPAKPALRPARSTTMESLRAGSMQAGSVIHQVVPDVPRSARNTIQGKVRVGVKVSVDSQGNVVDAALASPGPSKYFARLAEQAARDWKFSPAQSEGQPVSSEWMLRFAFGRGGTDVSPSPINR